MTKWTNVLVAVLLMLGESCDGAQSGGVKEAHVSPMGQIRIIDRALKPSDESRVDIWKYGTIYAALGVTSERFADWERRYGMDSLGVAPDGSLFVPRFPVLSKVAWTYIDPVDLSDSETRELLNECETVIAATIDGAARDLFVQIRDLALQAIRESKTLRFGHP